jgi:hypothetical protein
MKNQRILSYRLSQCLSKADLECVSATGFTHHWSGQASNQGAWDVTIDVTLDT